MKKVLLLVATECNKKAAKKIAKLLNTESAVITASAAAGLTESIASFMTSSDIKKIYQFIIYCLFVCP